MSTEAENEAKREAFFAKIPDPPSDQHIAPGEGDGEEPAPKDAALAKSSKETPVSKKDAPASSAKTAESAELAVADRVLAALKAGDLDTLAELTEQDPAVFDEKSTKWAARNRRESKLKADLAKVKAEAEAVVEHYAPVDERVERFQATRDYSMVAEIVELLTGESWAEASAKVGARAPRADVQARTARLADERVARVSKDERALREAVADDLPDDHQVRKLPDWEDAVVAVLRESIDEYTGEPELSFKQAAARVVRREKDRLAKLAKAFGQEPPARGERGGAPERAAGTAPAPKRQRTRDEFFAAYAVK